MKSFMPFIALHFLLLSTSCTNAEERVTESYENNYPDIIVQENAEELYDDFIWMIYCMKCDRAVPYLNDVLGITDSSDKITYGMLPLKFVDYAKYPSIYGDYMEFHFYHNGKSIYDYHEFAPSYIAGVFNEQNDSLMFLASSTHLSKLRTCEDTLNCTYREVKPLQPDVITYIQNNKNKLAPWFRNEAIKRGVIEP